MSECPVGMNLFHYSKNIEFSGMISHMHKINVQDEKYQGRDIHGAFQKSRQEDGGLGGIGKFW